MSAAPRVAIEVAVRAPRRLEITVANETDDALTVKEIVVPHGRFRAGPLATARSLAPRARAAIDVGELHVIGGAGDEIENAFVIVRFAATGGERRAFARLRVRIADDGVPHPRVERVDVQEVTTGG